MAKTQDNPPDENEMEESQHNNQPTPPDSPIPNDLWLTILGFLTPGDLMHSTSPINKHFFALASNDLLWEIHCAERWKGKINIARFYIRENNNDRHDGGNNDRERRESKFSFGNPMFTSYILQHFPYTCGSNSETMEIAFLPALNMNLQGTQLMQSLTHEPSTWKEAYLMAELDSKRTYMTGEELSYFSWKLVYDGSESRMGLRRFHPNGTYHSPYLGTCEWTLSPEHDEMLQPRAHPQLPFQNFMQQFRHYLNGQQGQQQHQGEQRPAVSQPQQLSFAGMSLLVERDPNTWGWIIGRGQRTVYYSVECST